MVKIISCDRYDTCGHIKYFASYIKTKSRAFQKFEYSGIVSNGIQLGIVIENLDNRSRMLFPAMPAQRDGSFFLLQLFRDEETPAFLIKLVLQIPLIKYHVN
jgi:hypothetical protein